MYNYWLYIFIKTEKNNIKFTNTFVIFADKFIKVFLAPKFQKFKSLIGIKNIAICLKNIGLLN